MRDAEKVDIFGGILGRVGTLRRPETLRNWEFGIGAVGFRTLCGYSSGFSLYLRFAAVPLQSGSRWGKIFYLYFGSSDTHNALCITL